MTCGRSSPALPIAIQCVSLAEARRVAGTLQNIVNSLPMHPDTTQLLAAFGDSPLVRTLLEDTTGSGFYAVVIGVPPGVHRTSESAACAEGTFKYPIRRHSHSFWEALAFLLVKGINERMPPLLTSTEILNSSGASVEAVDVLGDAFHTLSIAPHTPESTPPPRASSAISRTSSAQLRASPSTPNTPSPRTQSHASSSTPHTPSTPSTPSSISVHSPHSDTLSSSSRARSELSPIVYSHIRNLRGIIASRHYPTSMSQVLTRAQPLGGLAARYLASHGYSLPDVDVIIRTYRHAKTNEQFTMKLARDGMAVDELNFLLELIDWQEN
ncbi:hypothetical protein HYDPIDRAFT_170548 [Hydnomerulius pinastri MD-312]|uniref:Unplaced genomic scaffold scaffold_45, whole genome shotgun sequence n=1 Tax=Hydnomerulius pinastri MD-312 TaxID=994086 RepID=A0A0C9W1P6_9AGAM|nr:hypothetical protein HYDPIDRAFT_170548 [Hydnomerulius pinastri MD-312]